MKKLMRILNSQNLSQNQIDKLKNANNAQLNNENQSKVNNMLEDINTKFDSIKAKLENILNGSNSGN